MGPFRLGGSLNNYRVLKTKVTYLKFANSVLLNDYISDGIRNLQEVLKDVIPYTHVRQLFIIVHVLKRDQTPYKFAEVPFVAQIDRCKTDPCQNIAFLINYLQVART